MSRISISSMLTGVVSRLVWRFGLRFRFEGLCDIHEIIPAFLISLPIS